MLICINIHDILIWLYFYCMRNPGPYFIIIDVFQFLEIKLNKIC